MNPLSVKETWEDAVFAQLTTSFLFAENHSASIPDDYSSVDLLESLFDHLAHDVNNGNLPKLILNGENVYFYITSYSIRMLEDILDITDLAFLLNDMGNLLIKKQLDYGPKNILKFGHVGLIIRMYDKMARLKNLADKSGSLEGSLNKNSVPGETVVDTLMDLIGYSTIGLMLLDPDEEYENKFLLPFK